MAGGNGGGQFGGSGGTGYNGQAGGDGRLNRQNYYGGGGGAAGGGMGGTGAGGAAGGAGGTANNPDGSAGHDSTNGHGGGGGGGGFNGETLSGASSTSVRTYGGAGGRGGSSTGGPSVLTDTGGGGGAGGYGIIFTGIALDHGGSIYGGAGGAGGNGEGVDVGAYGHGGDGGVGLFASAGGASITNGTGYTIRGGQGGASGTASGPFAYGAGNGGAGLVFRDGGSLQNFGTIQGGASGGAGGTGGVGLVGAYVSVLNRGTIAGGGGAAAIEFTGGVNSLTLGGTLVGAIAIDDGASLEITRSGTLANAVDFTSGTGTLGADAGLTLTLTGHVSAADHSVFGSSTDNGTIVFGSGSTLSGTDAIFAAGTDTFAKGSTISVSTFEIDGATVNLGATVNYRGAFDLEAGTLNVGVSNLNSLGSLDLAGGTITGSGRVASYGTGTLEGHVFTAGSTTLAVGSTMTATGNLSLTGSSDLLVYAKGIYDLAGNGYIGARSDDDVVTNKGLIEKTAGRGTSLVTADVANTGTIEVAKGTLDLTGDITGTGTLSISGNSAMELGSLISANQTAKYGTGNGHLVLDDAREFHATISGYNAGDTITLKGFDDHARILYEAATDGSKSGTLAVYDGDHRFATHIDGTYTAKGFSLTHTATGETIHYAAPKA